MNDPPHAPAPSGGGAVDIHQPFTPAERIQQLADIDNDVASLLTHLSHALRALATPPPGIAHPNGTATSTPSNGVVDPMPDPEGSSSPSSPSSDPVSSFKAAQSAFFNTIDRVDKHLTRQILALEEAGIVTLRSSSSNRGGGSNAAVGGGDGPLQHNESLGMGAAAGPGQQQQQLAQAQAGGGGEGAASDGGKAKAAAPVARLEPDGMGRYGKLDVGKLNMASSTVERDMEEELWRRAREQLARVVGGSGAGQGQEGDRMEE
ncbi:866d7096-448d-4342-b644-f79b7b429306 [Thermothielavioides terrestris]|uniref:Mediator of RNA polymerase II transcription subunit 11 n=1 Tax=Thermothielavioides terrestris TaxID=2587410 RepID=A0A3S4AMC6_9PEZI|nr:866d7096-448d-4342-b644-f79b7b429306 [Thermothielavioides terrestris]